jgi:hypothetical protein
MEKDNLLAESRDILNKISGKVWKSPFIQWERRLQTRRDAGGEQRVNNQSAITHNQQARRRVVLSK